MRVYSNEYIEPKNEYTEKVFSTLYDIKKKCTETLGDEYIKKFYEEVRTKLKLPNKVFSFVKLEDGKVVLCFFDVEPGKIFDVSVDEETHHLYIETEDNVEN